MLPRIHLGSLLTATNSQIATQSKQQRQAAMETRANRNLEGFYVYQTYLRRLRRMHRAYVRRYRQAHPDEKGVPPLPPPGTSEFYTVFGDNEGGLTPVRHRLALSDTDSKEGKIKVIGDQETYLTPPPTPETGMTPNTSDPNAIHIPCGRESSFHDLNSARLIPAIPEKSYTNNYKKRNVRDMSSLNYSHTREALVKDGALPFRRWRQQQGRKGAGSVYSYATITEEKQAVEPDIKFKGNRLLRPRLVGLPIRE